ncbi:unnamed protein product [Ostreobium quekettii]|uniref:glutathione gamma-glutamylcysteinyltransferase n=1 Tax=Ostreobium quekettii TaxID=121088 RepID=A0A8S1IVA2_9CHLO|nr:unnamed protein product [Ostreobium quekettii]
MRASRSTLTRWLPEPLSISICRLHRASRPHCPAVYSRAALQDMQTSFYKRKLPVPPATEFSSSEGRTVFQEALDEGNTTGFFKLIEQFRTQDEPAFCGLSSVAMVLNALSIDPLRKWKGPWRWFDETMLDCCKSLEEVKTEGIILEQAACLARCNGAKVKLRKFGSFSLEDFRRDVVEVCTAGDEHIIVSYSRKTMKQTGDGHFSPVGAYNSKRDLVLILDTARFKYPPHWVQLSLLYESMSRLDPETNEARGYMHLSAPPNRRSVMFTLGIREPGWREAELFIRNTAPTQAQMFAASGKSGMEILVALAGMAPLDSIDKFISIHGMNERDCGNGECGQLQSVIDAFSKEFESLPIFQVVLGALGGSESDEHRAKRVCALLLLRGESFWPGISGGALSGEWKELWNLSKTEIVATEVQNLRFQFDQLVKVGELGGGATDLQPWYVDGVENGN